MSIGKTSILTGITLFALSNPAIADVESNTVPTDHLVALFSVSKSADSPHGTIDVTLLEREDNPAGDEYQSLTVSANEAIQIVSNGVVTVFDPTPGADNHVSYAPSARYSVSFTRPDGQAFQAEAEMPANEVAMSAPVDGAVFDKSEAVEVDWNAVASQKAFTYVSYEPCADYRGDIAFNPTSIVVPAGFGSLCPQKVGMIAGTSYMNWAQFKGLDGVLSVDTSAHVAFSLDGTRSSRSSSGLLADLHRAKLEKLRHLLTGR